MRPVRRSRQFDRDVGQRDPGEDVARERIGWAHFFAAATVVAQAAAVAAAKKFLVEELVKLLRRYEALPWKVPAQSRRKGILKEKTYGGLTESAS